ncbi:MAG: endonuclease/exonuclease/phosphatase family protein [Bacteroidales bacterium]|nr:endonuclease/exonuclease/phosphatase family protein [Candidatus Sodaliphilus fimicaballi]
MARRKKSNILFTAMTTLCVIVLLMCAGGGYCNPALYGFVPGVMTLLLPVAVVVALAWCIVLLLTCRWRNAVAVATALILTSPVSCLQCPLNMPQDCGEGNTFTVMTYNVASFPHMYTQDTSTVMRNILDIDADFVLMQDMPHWIRDYHYDTIKGLKPYYEELKRKYPYRSHPYADEVAILSRYPFTMDTIVPAKRGFESLSYLQDLEHHPAMAYDVVVNGHKLRLISVHLQSYGLSNEEKGIMGAAPQDTLSIMPGSKLEHMSFTDKLNRAFSLRASDALALREAIDRGPQTVIVCGDFNDVAGSYAYRTVMGDDMNDSWAQAGRGYAWTFALHRFYFKIDHILYRGPLQAVDAKVYNKLPLTYTASDHYPQVTKFEIY